MSTRTSILDDLGQEVTGIVAPVSICMFLTIVLVRLLNPEGNSNPSAVAIAQTYYKEQESDSTGTKFEGALINALIFVVIVGAMTFVLFLLFKYKCDWVIFGYMAFAAFIIFFIITGVVAIQLIQMQPIPLDAISFYFILWNFSVVGTMTLFIWPAPMLLKQAYMVATGVITAFLFTGIPEWTTWILLIAMAIYDIAAVLTPNGPLKLLVDLAIERDADIPALVYEARPAGRPPRRRLGDLRPTNGTSGTDGVARGPLHNAGRISGASEELELADRSSRSSQSQEATTPTLQMGAGEVAPQAQSMDGERPDVPEVDHQALPASSLAAGGVGYPEADQEAPATSPEAGHSSVEIGANDEGEGAPLIRQSEVGHGSRQDRQRAHAQQPTPGGAEEIEFGLPDAIKLGMGDFIFYSVLVGRAAMYDMLTVFASYLAIVAGLGATLLLLALSRKALPALPFSIALGVAFYFLARLVLEPFVVPLSVHLLYF